ncbi:kynureninase-like [Rhopilema esculentum]|uniref:kynureninase-like n=1 Tax=Rhopilema esculentum TaxID=499914 RepID=UPI0031DC1F72
MAAETLRKLAKDLNCDIHDEKLAAHLDSIDELKFCRSEFQYPKNKNLPPIDLNLVDGDEDCIYLCSNSLGLMPKKTADYVQNEVKKWSEMALYGHHHGVFPWEKAEDFAVEPSAKLVGAKPAEVAIMNSLTVNLHFLMIPFYRPTPTRYRILIEDKAFPSDHYAVESQIRFHGFDPKDALILAKIREGEENWRTEDIVSLIEKEGDSIALVLFSGVHYYSGQLFDMKAITEAGHRKGCIVGFDLAHAVGNVPMSLHDWDVDFAAWCTYKYLSSGAGGIAGIFVNEKHTKDDSIPRLNGWWAHRLETRFTMDNKMDLSPGAAGFMISNANMFATVCLIASLEIFDRVGMEKLREKSLMLTGYLELLIEESFGKGKDPAGKFYIEIVTPRDPNQRGCQLSVRFSLPIIDIKKELDKRGVVCDKREPNVLRVAPVPMVNKFHDVWRFIKVLKESADTVLAQIGTK